MRRLLLLAPVLLAACQQEPSFDERYDRAEKQVRAKAAEIDRELQSENHEATPPSAAR